jgi:hypothetical protein
MLIDIKPKTITHICCLITGDRFYCNNDKKKIIWELRFHTLVKFRNEMVKLSICKNGNTTKRFNANRVVVFMRSTNAQRQSGYKKIHDQSLDRFFIY